MERVSASERRRFVPVLLLLLCAVLMVAALPIPVHADMGPKPSVRIRFTNMDDTPCYGTLLSKHSSTGPAAVWDGTEEDARNSDRDPSLLDRAIWEAFVGYQDPDGFYFLQVGCKVSETKEIAWTYYPPSSFKILLYYPETGTFVSSGICERYAFDTYYTVDMRSVQAGLAESLPATAALTLTARRTYPYGQELLSLAVRILLTIALEMLVALLFGLREKKQLRVLALVNAATQIALNGSLHWIRYQEGPLAFAIFYVLLEMAVFVIEAVLYCTALKKVSAAPKKNGYYVAYALVANLVSFAAGFFLARILPGIF